MVQDTNILGRLNLKTQVLSEKLILTAAGASKTNLLLAPMVYTTELLLLLKANITTVAAVLKEDTLIRLIKTFVVKGSTQTYIDIGTPIHLASLVKVRGDRYQADTVAAAGTADYFAILPIHLGIGKANNLKDFTVVLPDNSDTSLLQVEVQGGSAADLGTGVTINSVEIQVAQSYLSLNPMQIQRAFRAGIRTPKITTSIYDLTSLQSNLGARYEVPVKSLLNRTIFTVVDSSGNRSNSQISEVGIINNISTEQPSKLPFILAVQRTMARHELLAMPTGIVCFEWGDIPGGTLEVGYDTKSLSSRELQIGASIIATGGKVYVTETCIGKAR